MFETAGGHETLTRHFATQSLRGFGLDDDDLRVGGARDACRSGKPDVLADDDSDANAGDVDDAGIGARLEVAIFVEHRIVRQLALVIDRRDPAVTNHRRRVVPLAAAGRPAQMGSHQANTGVTLAIAA